MPDGVALIVNGRIEYYNPSLSDLLHYESGEVKGMKIEALFQADDLPQATQLISEVVSGGPEYPLRLHLISNDNKEIPVEFFVRQLTYGDASAGLICVFRDLTVEQRFAEALGEVEDRYRTLVENAPEAIVVYDANTGRFVEMNSTGGTFVNGAKVLQAILYPGDQISLAGVLIKFVQDSTEFENKAEDYTFPNIPIDKQAQITKPKERIRK